MPARVAGDLYVADDRQMGFDLFRQITAHHLTMVEVHLEKQVIAADALDDLARLCRSREKGAGIITGVEGFDEHANPVGFQHVSSPAQVANKDRLTVLSRHSGRGRAGRRVQVRTGQCLGVLQGAPGTLDEFFFTPRERGNPPFPTRSVAWWEVAEHLLQTMRLQTLGDGFGGRFIREAVLDAVKARACGRFKTLEKAHFLKEKSQIGC
jgi:hypothetical protein